MTLIHTPFRAVFSVAERGLDRIFGPSWNPLYNLGALGFFMYWIVAVSGIYIYIFFDTGLTEAYDSVEYMTNDQWYLAGVMRSLHRYASDAMVLFMLVHIVREFALDRYRGPRWFTWVTGTPILILVIVCGISGYWLVWDRLAQYVAIKSTEFFDWLPIFGTPVAANFLRPESLDDRFFSLMIFIHIAAPLILLFILWIHLQRVTRPRINPPRGLAIGMFVAMLALSLVKPAVSHGPADLSTVVSVVRLDWYYLGLYPLVDIWPTGAVWGLLLFVGATLILLPWMPPMRRAPVATVQLEHCNGCRRCVNDCPYAAVTMRPRTDGRAFDQEATVNPSLCVSCGICVGACPSSTPFRRRGPIATGIDLPHLALAEIKELTERTAASLKGDSRVMIFGCEHGARLPDEPDAGRAGLRLPCIGMLPPAFIDYVLSNRLAEGVFLTGCREGNCFNRMGEEWTLARIARERDPHLRARVPRERIGWFWADPFDAAALEREITAFAGRLNALPAPEAAKDRKRRTPSYERTLADV